MSASPEHGIVALEAFTQVLRPHGARVQFAAGAQIFQEGEIGDLAYLMCARHGAQRHDWRCQPEGESRPGSDLRVKVPWRP